MKQRVPVGDEALGEEAIAGLDDIAFLQAELLGNRRVCPEAASSAISDEVEKEKERNLGECECGKAIPQSMIDPGEVARYCPNVNRIDRRSLITWIEARS